MDPKCVFCKVIAGELPSKRVGETEKIVAIYTIKPEAPVHILLIPKKHIESLDSLERLDGDLIGDLFLTAKRIAKEKGISGNYKVVINVGERAGQTVKHLHIHIIGGWKSKGDVESQLKL